MTTSREQFEAEFRKENEADPRCEWLLQMYNHGTDEEPEIDYYSLAARDAWKWWQKSRAALVVELPQRCMCGANVCKAGNFQISRCEKAVREAGITVKGDR